MFLGLRVQYSRELLCYLAVHGFLQPVYVVDEDARLDTEFRRSVKGTSQFGDALILNGGITAAADGTASRQTEIVESFTHIHAS